MSRRLTLRSVPFLAGVIAALILVVASLLLFTQTRPGRERILQITLETLGGQLSGESELVVERLEGGLFTGARLYDIVLRDPSGQEMVAADSAYIEYRLATFFGGDVVIQSLVLYHPDVLLYRMPGDSLWNYQAVLQDTTPAVPGRRGRATIVEELRLVDGMVTVRMPWEPADDLSRAERAREIQAALSDTSRLAVEEVPGGYLRTMLIRTPDTALESLVVAPDERGGTYLRIAHAAALVGLFRDEPLRLQALEGELSFRSGVMRYALPRVELPDSRLATSGVLDLSGDEPMLDVVLSGEGVALADMRWLHPPLPEDGRASFRLGVETRPDNVFMQARDLVLEAPGTRIVGEFGVLMGDSLLFSDVSLRAEPLDVRTVERMLPMTIPVRGLQIGAVRIESPAS